MSSAHPQAAAAGAQTQGPAWARIPLIVLAATGLVTGLWGGLLLLGVEFPAAQTDVAAMHGPLMVFGFLGTLVALERAVAIGRGWAYAAPLASGLGALSTLVFPGEQLGPALITVAGVIVLAAYAQVDRIQRSSHNAVMALGAVAWIAAAAAWLADESVSTIVYLMAGFLVLTIVGERLELSRAVMPPKWAHTALLVAIGVFALALTLTIPAPEIGVPLSGLAQLAQASWLARFDVARRTVRMQGLTRYMAVALLAGYVWLAVTGAIWLLAGDDPSNAAYDASLHALFLGFAISMVFAHAPVIFPSVLRVPVPYRPRYYAHLILLHVSLVIRIAGGDLAGNNDLWKLGGILNELAIVLFLLSTIAAVVGARSRAELIGEKS
jgi:hypothetical protein